MAYKLLVSGESGSGKTSLTKGLKNSLVISHDGKIYPYPNPHAIIEKFSDANELIDFVETKALAYKERFGSLPETIVFDSVSRIFETFSNACNTKYTGFTIYSELNKRIAAFAEVLEQLVDNGINVIIISHAIYDADTSKYLLVGSGSFSKMGGFYSVSDMAA
jgi:excinuclease UvrABC ATPase subunit